MEYEYGYDHKYHFNAEPPKDYYDIAEQPKEPGFLAGIIFTVVSEAIVAALVVAVVML